MRYLVFVFIFIGFSVVDVTGQIGINKGNFTNLEEALKNPDKVKRLDLTGQKVELSDEVLSRFKNLEYLSLKDDHLKEVPHGIVYLNKLKVLDLSGNNFNKLPEYINELENLEEVFLNSESNLDMEQSLEVLTKLPNLKSLHLEGDGLKTVPIGISNLESLENLYLTNNDIEELPRNIKLPKNLKMIDLQMNKFGEIIDKENRFGKGIIIRF